MKYFRSFPWSPAIAFALCLLAGTAIATTCKEDCHGRCRQCVKYDLGVIKDEKCIIEPQCHIKCEAEKKAACLVGAPIPSIPSMPTGPMNIPGQLNQACKAPFESFTHSVIAYCANWEGRADDFFLIDEARNVLVQMGFVQAEEFNGVDIRWCPLRGNGMAPERDRILLHPNLKNNQKSLIAVLGHEMFHMRQYRRWGGDDFKCRYSKEIIAGKGQERSNYVEREAYEFEDQITNRLAQAFSMNPGGLPQMAPAASNRCGTPFGACFINAPYPVGSGCWCPSFQGPVGGQVF